LTATILDYGDPKGYSSMAKLVGIPCGVAAQQVLDGVISTPGILAPLNAKINGPLIETLEKEGIECKEEIVA
jgi:saccharopine dehydrogenase (NADP+, L-glutamate forming)